MQRPHAIPTLLFAAGLTALALSGVTVLLARDAAAEDLPNASEFFDEYDTNSDGKVTGEEFGGASEIFKLIDKDGDGCVTPSELGLPVDYKPDPRRKKRATGRAADAPGGRSAGKSRDGNAARRMEEMRKRLLAMDADKDGKVTRAEWQGQESVFDRLDRNKDGVLDKKDRRAAGGRDRAKGAARTPRTIEQSRKQFQKIDKNEDGRLTADEVPNPKLMEAADADGDGGVTVEEFLGFMQKRANAGGRDGGKRGDGQRRRGGRMNAGMLKRWDRDGDGKVSADEFPGRDEAFARFDADKDGFLTEADIVAAKTKKPDQPKAPTTPSSSADPFADQDSDGDGRLTRAEFSGTNADWRALDKDGDGYVTRAEAGK